jgi:hypothetical protein
MRSLTQSSVIRRWVTVVCLTALVLAASVDTGHVCGALQASPKIPHQASWLQPAAGYCPICALAQPATPGVMPVAPAPAMSVSAASLVPEPQLHSFQGLFALNVRPPPA